GRNSAGGDMLMDLIVQGNLGTLTANGVISGDVQVFGDVTDKISATRVSNDIGALLGHSFNNVVDLTAYSDSLLYVIDETSGGAFELSSITRNSNGSLNAVTLIGTLSDGTNLSDVQAIEVDPTDSTKLYVIAKTNGASTLSLYTVDTTNGTAVTTGITLDVDPATEEYSSLAFVGTSLYMVNTTVVNDGTNDVYVNQLYKIDLTTQAINAQGQIDLPDGFDDTIMYVAAMDTDADQNLRIYVADSTDPDNGSIIEMANPSTSSYNIPGLVNGFVIATGFFSNTSVSSFPSTPSVANFGGSSTTGTLVIPAYSTFTATNFDTSATTAIGTVSDAAGYTSDYNTGVFYQLNDNASGIDDVLYQTQNQTDPQAQFGLSLITGNVVVHGTLNNLTATSGHITGNILAGGSINTLSVTDGSLGLGERITLSSAFGNIGTVNVTRGNVNAQVIASNGSITSFTTTDNTSSTAPQVSGDLLAGTSIEARQLLSMTVGGSMRNGVTVSSEYQTNTLNVTGDVEQGVGITLGDLSNSTIGGDFNGTLFVDGINATRPTFTVNGDMDGTATFTDNATVVVNGDFGTGENIDPNTPIASDSLARINIHNNGSLSVGGDMHGDLVVGGRLESVTADNIYDSTVVAGGRISTVNVSGTVSDSVFQAGLSSGNDGIFASDSDSADLFEGGTLESIISFTAGIVSNSIIAAGNGIDSFRANTSIDNSSVVSGFVLGHSAVASLLNRNLVNDDNDDSVLSSAERTGLLADANRTLLYGDITTAFLGSGNASNVNIIAGIDVGDDGIFGAGGFNDDAIVRDLGFGNFQGGGRSNITNISGGGTATNTYIAADSIISTNTTSGTTTNTFNPTDEQFFNSIGESLVGIDLVNDAQVEADGNVEYSLDGSNYVRIQVIGQDTIYIRDTTPGDNFIDAIYVLKGAGNTTFSATSINIQYFTDNEVQIGKIITADDVSIANIDVYNLNGNTGTLWFAGDGDRTTPDMWLDSTNGSSYIRSTSAYTQDTLQVAANFSGYVAGGVQELRLGTIDSSARFNIAGDLNYFIVMSSETGTDNTISYTVDTSATVDIALVDSTVGNTTIKETVVGSGYQFYAIDSTGNAAYYYVVQISETVDDVETITYEGRIDIYDSFSTFVTTYSSQSTNITGLEYDLSDNLVAMTTDTSYLPSNEVVSSIDTSNYAGLAINSEGRVFTVNYDSNGLAHVLEVMAQNGTTKDLGTIRDVLGLTYDVGNTTYGPDIVQIAFDADDNLILLSRDNGNGPDVTTQYVMMQIDAAELEGDDQYLAAHSPSSAVLARKSITNLITGLEVTGFAYNTEDGYFYASANNGTSNIIYRFSKTDSTATVLQSDDTGTTNDTDTLMASANVTGIGFDADNNLVVQVNDGTDGTLYVSDLTYNTTTLAYTYSLDAASNTGAVDSSIAAFAIGLVDGNEIAFGYSDSSTGTIFQSAKPGSLTTILGTVTLTNTDADNSTLDDNSFTFLQSASLLLGENQIGSSMTFDAANNTAYIVTVGENPRLWSVDLDTNTVTDIGQLQMNGTEERVQIGSLVFDSNGTLIGNDTALRRIVSIDITDATVTARTESGTVDSSVSDLSIDIFDQITGLADGDVVNFFGTTMDQLGGITARRVVNGEINVVNHLSTTGRETFAGRVVSTNADNNQRAFESLIIRGNFDGVISTNNMINNIIVYYSDFNGSIVAEDINYFTLYNNGLPDTFGSHAVMDINDQILSLTVGGVMDGKITASRMSSMHVSKSVGSEAVIAVDHYLGDLTVVGDFDGQLDSAYMSNLNIGGLLGDDVDIHVHGDMSTLTLTGGTSSSTMVQVDGDISTVNVGGTHRGTISVFGSVTNSTLANVDSAIYNVALGGSTLNITGTSSDAYLIYGAWLGADGLLNTADDMITGGSLTSATIGTMRDTVLAAGVLPSSQRGQIEAGTINAFNFQDNTETVDGVDTFYSVEAGGILPSSIGSVSVNQAINSNDLTGRFNLVVAADSVPDAITGTQNSVVRRATYNDQPGGPQVVSVTQTSDSIIEIVFNEELNANTLSLTTSDNPLGSITIRDFTADETLIDSVEIEYVTRTNAAGQTIGVIRLKSTDFAGFSPLTYISLSDGSDGHQAVLDRSGTAMGSLGKWSRSAMSDFNQDGQPDQFNGLIDDLAGTVIDGDADGKSGGIYETFVLGDNADGFEFLSALLNQTDLDVNKEVVINDSFNDYGGDPFVMGFEAEAGQFFSYNYNSFYFDNAVIGVFYQDDQGTESVSDDTFELVGRYEYSDYSIDEDGYLTGNTGFQAMQLADAGNYFLVVDSAYFYYNEYFSDDYYYESEFELTVGLYSDASLIDVPLDENGDPTDQIAYTPGTANNEAKQLVYLNFDGGLATGYTDYAGNPISYDVDAFDIEDLGYAPYLNFYDEDFNVYNDAELAAFQADLIEAITNNVYGTYADALLGDTWLYDGTQYTTDSNGDGIDDVTATTADSQFFDIFAAAQYGIYFTTVDPSTYTDGNGDAVEYSTVFLGEVTQTQGGFGVGEYGQASDVDLMNMNKSDVAYIALQNFHSDYTRDDDTYQTQFDEVSTFIANVAAHELGHILGFNHTNIFEVEDDLDNNPLTPSAGLGTDWYNIMSAGPASSFDQFFIRWQFGTSNVWDSDNVNDDFFNIGEFPIGQIDTLDLLLKWFGTP
ncbi:MAG TPA: hypothetical protein DER01_14850, partial [Phycisphaerales bacterium]|nr:hypothetical protein [Phycisphaerales bacterium]